MSACCCLQNDARGCFIARLVSSDGPPFVADPDETCECVCHLEAREDARDEEDARA